MRKIFVLFALISNTAFAAPQIQWTTDQVPLEIQQRVEQEVAERCEVFGNGLKEARARTRVERVDQGVVDYFYAITLSTNQRVDQMLFEDVDAVQVEVAHWSFSNPTAGDPIEVQSVKGLQAARCR